MKCRHVTCHQCEDSDLAEMRRERDELREKLEESEHQMHLRIRAGYDKTVADSWRAALKKVEAERDALKAEVEMLRGVGCREAKEGEPESGPCGVCLKCAEERGAKWALDAALDKADLADTTNEAFYGVKGLRAEEICADARGKR